MIYKKELYSIIEKILQEIFQIGTGNGTGTGTDHKGSSSTKIQTSVAHVTGIKNIHTQNFEEYLYKKFTECDRVVDLGKGYDEILTKIKSFYAGDKIYQSKSMEVSGLSAFFNAKSFGLLSDKIYLVKNIYGTQNPPDYTLLIDGYLPILLEAKSAKGKRPLWNCSLPNRDTIYLFYSGYENRIFIHASRHIIDDETEAVLREVNQQMKDLATKANQRILAQIKGKNTWDYYPRAMYNQKFNYDLSMIDPFFTELLEDLMTRFIKSLPHLDPPDDDEEEEKEEEEDDSIIRELEKLKI